MNEIWKDIDGFEGLYQVSNLGRVRSLNYNKTGKTCILKECVCHDGYRRVSLYNRGKSVKHKRFFVHRLVAWAFPEICGEWFEGAVVNHKDECTWNNIATNLEVCKNEYNLVYGTCRERRVQTRKKNDVDGNSHKKRLETLRAQGHPKAPKRVIATKDGVSLVFDSLTDASKHLGCSLSHVSNVVNGKLPETRNGYKIKRVV